MAWDHLGASYDAVADRYVERFLHELDAKPRDRELLDELARCTTGPVVDVGCGPGQIGAYVRARGRQVIGVDLSPAMVVQAAGRLDGAAVADLRALPLADGAVGAVVAFYSLIHVRRAELAGAVAELARVLRPAGRMLCSAHEGEGEVGTDDFLDAGVGVVGTLFTLPELVEAARTAGLDVISAERRPPYANEGTTTRLYVLAARPGAAA